MRRSPASATAASIVHYRPKDGASRARDPRAKIVIGADGALSAGRPAGSAGRRQDAIRLRLSRDRRGARRRGVEAERCEIHYRGTLSPDFYAWIFPHGDTMSVGTGSANKGFSLKALGEATCAR